MATATATQPYMPSAREDHPAELERRAKAREARRGELRKCLDPEVAARFETRKPEYEWTINCTYTRPNSKGRLVGHAVNEKVIAQTEADAWAMVCDKIGAWPGPKDCERVITRGDKVN